jgi:cyclic beta-1,2-glucan synthetase
LQEQIMGPDRLGHRSERDRSAGRHLRAPAEQISSEDRILLQSVARAIISDSRGTLAEQLDRRRPLSRAMPRFAPRRPEHPEPEAAADCGPAPRFDPGNGLGGFTPDGREYVITLAPGQTTPAPWVNVLANPRFGTVVSESGVAYTWSENAHEFRLTPWHNDPVSDASGEAFYLRDEESGHFWSPTPAARARAAPYVVRHGFGYSVFEHTRRHRSELWVYVAIDARSSSRC